MDTSDYLRIGKVLGAHGLEGRLKVYIITDIAARFSPGNMVYLLRQGKYEAMTVSYFAIRKGRVALVSFNGLQSRNEAELLRGAELYIDRASADESRESLEEGSFYYYELIGAAVFWKEKEFGRVSDILEAGSGNILVIKRLDGCECMVPFVEEMVDTSRLVQNRIDINPVDGLFDAGEA